MPSVVPRPSALQLIRLCAPAPRAQRLLLVRWQSSSAASPTQPRNEPSPVTASHTAETELSPTPAAQSTPYPCPFYFASGYALHAKRKHTRPFPPPFLSRPSGSFSDPLSTHDTARDRRPTVNGELIRGITNGEDAVLLGQRFICAGDGVGAWATREKGNAALWSRLILHFWALEAEQNKYGDGGDTAERNPVMDLQKAYELTVKATKEPNEWFGTTTASGALIADDGAEEPKPVLYVTQLGDSTIMVVRPRDREIIYKTKEQWHWFDCPRQLGTNSPDTPEKNAVMDRVEVEENDLVLAMTDGVGDNLWDHEIMQNVVDSMHKWENGEAQLSINNAESSGYSDEMMYVAQELVKAARTIAEDPFAESPYMEKAIDEGLSIEGGE
jgi:serine/threonine protein phosphatase PrpC